ncbi:hypothetical protein [Rhodobacter sp. JA431]|uniref:hypothetical protein n=1 Tax=Rhodobacter sp. JA431 TaxID=570013 RepID=UPI0011602A0A|nr:hypothetical protein [Rhodobacter sp. JA431]
MSACIRSTGSRKIFATETASAPTKALTETLPERRAAAFKAFAAFGVKPDQIFEKLEIGGENDLSLDHLATLIAMHKAIKDGEQKVEDFFSPVKTDETPTDAKAKGTADKLAGIAAGATDKAKADKKTKEKAGTKQQDQPAEDAEKQAPDSEVADNGTTAPDANEQAAGDPETGDDAQADPDGKLEAARGRGLRAAQRGQERAVPPDLKKDEAAAAAWHEGYDILHCTYPHLCTSRSLVIHSETFSNKANACMKLSSFLTSFSACRPCSNKASPRQRCASANWSGNAASE